MTTSAPARELGWSYVEQFSPDDELLAEARRQAEVFGRAPVSPGAGSVLRVLAAAMGARAVAEVGTGTGVSGLWLLRGMDPDGVLTTVDFDSEQQRIAKEIFTAAGFTGSRVRLITGTGTEVLPRLADAAYDIVLLDILASVEAGDLPAHVEEAIRLLRPGGLLIVDKALPGGTASAPAVPGEVARRFCEYVRDDERLLPALMPVGHGLLCAVKRAAA